MRIFLIILGVLLLLPGACGLIVSGIALSENDSTMLLISLPSIAIGVGGFYLIRYAIRRGS